MSHPPAAEIRCTARHPRDPARQCRKLLGIALVPGTVALNPEAAPPDRDGCTRLRCERCGAEYVICPVRRSA